MKAVIKNLIENLGRQEEIYLEMKRLAGQHLGLATDPAGSELDEGALLKQKAKLIEDLQLITARARLIEADLAEHYGLPEFTLKGLQGRIDHDLHQTLAQAFARLGQVLKDITELDGKTVEIMNSRLSACRGPRQRPTNSTQALQASRDGSRVKKD